MLNSADSNCFHSPRFTSLRLSRTSAPCRSLRWVGRAGFAVVGHAGFARAEDEFVGCGIANAAGDGNAVFDHRDRNAKFRNALHEFARTVERVDNPDAALVESGEVVHRLFREPALARPQQVLLEDGVDGMIGLGDWVGADLILGLDVAGSEAV